MCIRDSNIKISSDSKESALFSECAKWHLFSGDFWKYASSSDNYTRTDQACALCSLSRKATGSASGGTGIYPKLCEESKDSFSI